MLKEDRDFVLSLGAIFIEEEIFYIKNFLSDDLLSKIQKEIEHHNKLESSGEKYTCYVEDNGNISTMQYEPWHYYEHGHSFDNIFPLTDLNIKKELHDTYDRFSQWPSFKNVEYFERHDVPWVKRRGPAFNEDGSLTGLVNGMAPHWDGDPSPKYVGKGNGQLQIPNRVKWGGVVYLNDDFEGGEINYLELNLLFKPIAGALVVHNGNSAKYRHSVNMSSGIRYNMIMNYMYGELNEPEPGEEVFDFGDRNWNPKNEAKK